MNPRPPACDEPLAEMRAVARLRELAKLESLEPSRAVDRAVLGLAREAASRRAPRIRAAGDARRRRAAHALRWGFPAAVAAAAVCAMVVQRTASRPAAARVAAQFIVERMQPSSSNALEMVRVSAHYRGAGSRVVAPAVSAYLAPTGLGESHRALVPSFILASVPLLSIGTAPLRKHGTEEQRPRAATRSSERASRRDREWTARRRLRPPELFDSVDFTDPVELTELRPAPPPSPAPAGQR
jgi:hypothetical protein